MKTFDCISDIHIDSWVSIRLSEFTQELLFHKLIKNILPENPSDGIVIAGDIGHYNKQNILFYRILKQYYKKILWVHGNHDMYLLSGEIKKKYLNNSFNRLNEMVLLSNDEENVEYLNGNTIEIDEVVFGGCSMWYNNDYAKKKWSKKEWTMNLGEKFITKIWGENDDNCKELYKLYMADASLIYTKDEVFDYLKYFDEQKELMQSVYQKCDVIISHIGPDWSSVLDKWNMPPTTFFYFDGKEFLNTLTKKHPIWVYGHTHDTHYYKHPSGCFMVCNPLDYGNKHWSVNNVPFRRKITTITVGEQPSYEDIFKI